MLRADSLFEAGDYEQAASHYRALAQKLTARKEYRAALRAGTQCGISYQKTSDYQTADTVLAQAIALAKPHLDTLRDTLLADAIHKRGIGYYMYDDNEEALSFFLQALKIREAALPYDHAELINSYYVTGATYRYLHRYDEALACLQQAIRRHDQVEPSTVLPLSYRMMADIYDQQGDAYQAVEYLNSALVICQSHFPENSSRIVSLHNDLAIGYAGLEQYTEAIRHARAALDLYCQHTPPGERELSRLANYYNTLASAYQRNDQTGPALTYYDSSLQLLRKAPETDSIGLAYILNNLGVLYKNRGQPEQARAYLSRAMELNRATGSRLALAANLHNTGEVWAQRQQPDSARIFQERALRLLLPASIPDTASSNLSALVSAHLDALLYCDALAKAYRQQGRLPQALSLYDSLDALIDRIRFSFLADDSKINLVDRTKPIYESAIDLCFDLHRQTGQARFLDQAFAFSEKSKAIVLLEAIKESKAKAFGIDAAQLHEEQELRAAIAGCEKQLFTLQQSGDTDSSRLLQLTEERIRLQQRYAAFIDQLEQQAPDYYRLKYDTRPLLPGDLQGEAELLAADQAMIVFFRGEQRLYRFYLTSGSYRLDTLDNAFPIETQLATMRDAIDGYLDSGGDCREFLESSWQLFDLLLADIYQELPEKLIIVPDDILGLLPFDALLTAPPEAIDCRDLSRQPYLLRDHTLSYCYSATLLREMKLKTATAGLRNTVLAFAPQFSGMSAAATPPIAGLRGMADLAGSGLPPLLFNDEEVQNIAQTVATRIISGEEADKAHFLSLAPSYRFLHFATHGVVDDENPDFSFIAFSQPEDSLQTGELLFVRELYDLNLPAEMVVLSACETGTGRVARGEGIVSMARGFSYAGVSSIVTTLWSISDQQSNALLKTFYQHLQDGKSKDEALRQAKLHYIEQQPAFAHPYYWAAFIPIGNMEKVNLPGPGLPYGWILGAALLLSAAALTWRIKRSR